MAYSTPAHSPTFSSFVAMSHDTIGHSVSSLPQLQPTSAAKKENTTAAEKNNAAKKRWGKLDTMDDTKYDDEDGELPLTDVALGEKQREQRRLAALKKTAANIEEHSLNLCRERSRTKKQLQRRKRPRVLPLHLL
jgi:hypothetical protein